MLSIKFRRVTSMMVVLVTLLSLFATAGLATPAAALETRNIVILGTSDIHGNVDNYDYFTDSVPSATSQRGLTKILSYVNNVRASNPTGTILIDNGDTIQGTPLAYYFNMVETDVENPVAAAMNYMGYAAATVGNHEFNYGPTVLNRYETETDFPLLSANVTGCRDYTFQPYVIQDLGGVQVGILGLTPPAVTHWERPENIVDCEFGDAMETAKQYVPVMQAEGADVIVVAAHTGLDETYGYGRDENFAKFLANEVPGIDVILAGHAHANVADQLVNGVLITEPNYHGRNLSDIRIAVSGSGSEWDVVTKTSTTPALGSSAEDAGLKALMQPYHDAAVAYINTPIGTATDAFPGGFQARIADGPMADLINQVQMEAAAEAGFPVEASLAALFTNDAKLNAGPIKLKDAYAVYLYDNTLYVIDATGQQIKDELEWTASYFNQYFYEPAGVTVNSTVRDYNYDLWSGIDYKIDVTKPVGQRVVELKLNGQPLAMDQVVRVALNNYRATGKFPTAPKLYQSTTEVRELITDWIMERGTISPSDVYAHNFTLLPPVNTWSSVTAGQPVSPSDYAGLLWTAFAGTEDDYLNFPGYQGPHGTIMNRQESFFVLGGAIDDLTDITADRSQLKRYSDVNRLLGWAKDPTTLLIQAGVFVPTDNKLLPMQPVSNAEALAWVREARYPLYTFLSTNDFHGALESTTKVSNRLVGNAAANMAYINNYRALNPLGTALFDAGDIMQGTPISNLLKGESVIDVYNHMGYQVAVVGNHEFDWGQAILKERIAQADFPFLAANIYYQGTDTQPEWLAPTAMLTVKGQKVGVIGVTSMHTSTIVMAGMLDGLEIRDPAPVVSQYAAELRAAGADIVIVLAHMPDVYGGAVTLEMATLGVPGVDLIISGHSHSNYMGKINNIPIIQQYSSGTAIGVSDLRYDRVNHNIAASNLQVVTTYNDVVTPDPAIAALVAEYKAEIAPTVNAVKASTRGIISRGGNDRYIKEVPMGDLIADAQAWKGGTEIAFMNPGGIRSDIAYSTYPHDITYGDFLTVQPFDNKLMTMTLTGSQIYALLEQQFPPAPTSMKLLQVSGIKYSFDLSKPAGSRIIGLTLTNGTPILPDARTYTVSCNEFIATGGDGFTTFLGGTNVTRTGVSDLDALIEYVQFKYGVPPANTSINPAIYPDGRITNITPAP